MDKKVTRDLWACRMCAHYQTVYDADSDAMWCGQRHCHSPILGGWFPAYQGILRSGGDYMARWCFFCGADAVLAVRVANRVLGVCERHRNHLRVRTFWDGDERREVYKKEKDGMLVCADRQLRDADRMPE